MKVNQDSNHTLKIISLGGLGEIGLNLMLFEQGDTILVVDDGVMFPEDYMWLTTLCPPFSVDCLMPPCALPAVCWLLSFAP